MPIKRTRTCPRKELPPSPSAYGGRVGEAGGGDWEGWGTMSASREPVRASGKWEFFERTVVNLPVRNGEEP